MKCLLIVYQSLMEDWMKIRKFVDDVLSVLILTVIAYSFLTGCSSGKSTSSESSKMFFETARSVTLEYSDAVAGLNSNPLKGFIPFAKNTSVFPYSMEWFYIPLRDIMTAENTFNWTALDAQLNSIASRGHQAAFRVYVDYPKRTTGIPQYLLDTGLATFSYDDSSNAASATPSVSPDYQDRRLIKAFTDFITALGARYDGDARIGYITAGLYGFWGEWHVHSHPLSGESSNWVMLQSDKELLLKTYLASFTKTIILIRYATITPDAVLKTSFGYHDDSFAYQTLGPETWHFWPQMTAAHLTNQWQNYPIGGEVRPEIQSTVWDSWPNTAGQDMATSIKTTHASWMMNSAVFSGTGLNSVQYSNALRAHRMLGYELYIYSVSTHPLDNGKLSVQIQITNRGVAPFYYNWPVQLAFADDNGVIIGSPSNTVWSLKTILPGSVITFTTEIPAPTADARKLVLRVANPLSNGNTLSFANKTQNSTVEGWVTLMPE
jgi:hypothetical protein